MLNRKIFSDTNECYINSKYTSNENPNLVSQSHINERMHRNARSKVSHTVDTYCTIMLIKTKHFFDKSFDRGQFTKFKKAAIQFQNFDQTKQKSLKKNG